MKLADASRGVLTGALFIALIHGAVANDHSKADRPQAAPKKDTSILVVKNAAEAAKLPVGTECVRVEMRRHNDPSALAAVLWRAPNIRLLDLYHPDNGVPAEAIQLLVKFRKLRELRITGDANLDKKAFATIGKLDKLESLRLKLP